MLISGTLNTWNYSICEWDDVYVYVRMCIGNGVIRMCDLVCLWRTHRFWQSLGYQMGRRRRLRDCTGCLTDLSHLLSSFCVCPMSDLCLLSVSKTVLLSSFLCLWLWNSCEDCRINCGSLNLCRKRSIISPKTRWGDFQCLPPCISPSLFPTIAKGISPPWVLYWFSYQMAPISLFLPSALSWMRHLRMVQGGKFLH